MSYRLIRRTQERRSAEYGPALKSPEGRIQFAISYPNTYFVGMSNLGIQAVYHHVNAHPHAVAERVFLPDDEDLPEFERTNTPLFTIESQRQVRDFHLLGFSLTFEEDYINVLRILKLAHIGLHVDDRRDDDPIIIAGGPCASYNPEPMTDFIDAFVIGDGEPVVPEILDSLYRLHFSSGQSERPTRREVLEALSRVEGLYVPSVTGYEHRVVRRSVEDVNAHPADTAVFTPDTEFANAYLVEIARGCPRRCKFCVIPYSTRPLKMSLQDRICEAARSNRQHADRVGLVGASVSDFPDIAGLCRRLVGEGFRLQLPSLRSDRLSDEFLEAIWQGGQRSITIAPEAATDHLRGVVAKKIPNDQIIDSVARAGRKGFRHVKLYFMIGLPGEREEDIEAYQPFIRSILKACPDLEQVAATINPFVPKPWTPMQWAGMDRPESLRRKVGVLNAMFRSDRHTEVRISSLRWNQVQTLLSIGDRSIGKVLYRAFELGGDFQSWRAAAEECGVDWDNLIHGGRPADFMFPWDHIDTGTKKERVRLDYERSMELIKRPEETNGH
ncbi:MAG: radical SAM protein [Armatimonadetes bacterium]|nr:radical SAM protein [Armatimonadota bacterium]